MDDLYDGFALGDGEGAQANAPASLGALRGGGSLGGGGGSTGGGGGGALPRMGLRPGTGARGDGTLGPAAAASSVRPMTSVAGAGYRAPVPGTGSGARGGGGGAPGSAGARAPPVIFPFKPESANGPEAQAAELEQRVHALLESSASAAAKGDPLLALERAKEATRRERALSKFRESSGLAAASSADLNFSVNFTLANMVRWGQPPGLRGAQAPAFEPLTPPSPCARARPPTPPPPPPLFPRSCTSTSCTPRRCPPTLPL
jgi:intraflagellar transport protein 88